MDCPQCFQEMVPSSATHQADLGDVLILLRNTPCFRCEACSISVYTPEVQEELGEIIEKHKNTSEEMLMLQFPELCKPSLFPKKL